MILSSGVMAFVGLDGLKNQRRCRESHLVVGGIVHPSRRTVFGRWSPHRPSLLSIVVLSALRGAWMASDRAEGTIVPRSLRGQCGMTALVRGGALGRARSLPVPPRVETEERLWGIVQRAMKARRRDRGRPLPYRLARVSRA